MQGRRAAQAGERAAAHWARAALVLLVACAFALMPLSMAHARAAAVVQPVGHHAGMMGDHCAEPDSAEPDSTPGENPLLSADTCAIACSVVLPSATAVATAAEPERAPLVAAEARSLHGIAPDISLPPPRTLPKA